MCGRALPLSDPIPLRTTAAWQAFAKPEVLPVVYGRCLVPAVQFDRTRKYWLVADHAIAGVDAVYRDGKPEKTYAWRNTIDSARQVVALVELGEPLATTETLTARVRGKLHPTTGALLENPADVMQDIFRLAGHVVADSAVAEFRAACAGLSAAGVLSDGLTIRAQLAEFADSVGMLWSPVMPGWAQRGPLSERPDGTPIYAHWAETEVSDVQASARMDALYTVLRVEYDWDWTQDRARRAVTLRASSAEVYGERAATLQAKWLTTTSAAVQRGTAWLQAYARPRWTLTMAADLADPVPPGGWFSVTHPLLPVAGELLALNAEWDWSNQRQRLTAEASAGTVPTISVASVGGLFDQPESQLRVTYANSVATLVIVDPNGAPIRDAVVTFDAQTAKTDRTGAVKFRAERGMHRVTVEAAGYAATTAEITL